MLAAGAAWQPQTRAHARTHAVIEPARLSTASMLERPCVVWLTSLRLGLGILSDFDSPKSAIFNTPTSVFAGVGLGGSSATGVCSEQRLMAGGGGPPGGSLRWVGSG